MTKSCQLVCCVGRDTTRRVHFTWWQNCYISRRKQGVFEVRNQESLMIHENPTTLTGDEAFERLFRGFGNCPTRIGHHELIKCKPSPLSTCWAAMTRSLIGKRGAQSKQCLDRYATCSFNWSWREHPAATYMRVCGNVSSVIRSESMSRCSDAVFGTKTKYSTPYLKPKLNESIMEKINRSPSTWKVP